MNSSTDNFALIRNLTKTLLKNNAPYVLALTFLHFIFLRLQRLLKLPLQLRTLPDEIWTRSEFEQNESTDYIDYYSCALASCTLIKNSDWYYICSVSSLKKYKIFVQPWDCCKENELFVSETMGFNVDKVLRSDSKASYVLLLASGKAPAFAKEATVSLILSPQDHPNDLTDTLLDKYFSEPRYLRPNDVFGVEIREYAPDFQYCLSSLNLETVYFKVKSLRTMAKAEERDGCYVTRGQTTLKQEANVRGYIPRRYSTVLPGGWANGVVEERLSSNCPPLLEESLEQLLDCVSPFLRDGDRMEIQPVFLVEGPAGCGKFELIRTAAERTGLHLISVDLAEVQSLTAAQTEAKLRIALNSVENCVPCILRLGNIQIFGKDFEGHRDERTTSAFSSELTKLYDKKLKYPVIVIATTDTSEISAGLQRIFIATIRVGYSSQNERTRQLSWLVEKRGLEHDANLSQIAGMCSDFVAADLEALVMHAAKVSYKTMASNGKDKGSSSIKLTQNDFVKAFEYMQSTFADQLGAPKVPKVHWEDIGGLAELKHEIIRRIELPLMNAVSGLGRSGLLLYGPPGTGKTLLAKAVATECQLHFLSVKGPELLNMYVGQSEKNVRQVFERARAAAPCVIFFDELDSLAPNRGRSGDSGGVMDRVVSQLLAEMDGLESSGSVFLIGATNRPDLVDPALLRPGRFDKMLYVGVYADRESQLGVLRAVTRNFRMREGGAELERVVDERLPDNLTGADLYAVCSDAWLLAVRRNLSNSSEKDEEEEEGASIVGEEIVVETRDFLEAAANLVPSVSREEMRRYEKLRSELSS